MSDPITTVRLQNSFRNALNRGRRQRWWRLLRGLPSHLLSLDEALQGRPVLRRPVRLDQVPLRDIRGSVYRARDYSPEFLPLSAADEARWLHVAEGIEGMGLPPVRLLRYRGHYFVEDGHHRISILKQLGADSTWAEVIDLVDATPSAPGQGAPFSAGDAKRYVAGG